MATNRRARQDALLRIIERPSLDFATAAAVLAGLIVAAEKWRAFDILGEMSVDRRLALYGQLLAVASLAVAAAGVALAAYTASGGPRMTLLRTVAGARLRRQFTSALTGPALAAGLILAAYVIQGGPEVAWSRWLAVAAVLLLAVRLTRLIYYFVGILRLADEDHEPLAEERRVDINDLPVRNHRRAD